MGRKKLLKTPEKKGLYIWTLTKKSEMIVWNVLKQDKPIQNGIEFIYYRKKYLKYLQKSQT